MKTVYIDNTTFCCYLTQNEDSTRIPYETDFFDGKCDSYILGFRIVPAGYEWVREDGFVFSSNQTMISAWKDYDELAAAQAQYELDMAEAAAAYKEGVNSAYDQ